MNRHKANKVESTHEETPSIHKTSDSPRKGWRMSFKKMAERGEDKLIIGEIFDDEIFDEWN